MLLTCTALLGTTPGDPLVPSEVGPLLTSIETSVTQMPPEPFQTFTCNVCHPSGELTGPLIDWAAQLDVEVLLSSEYPTLVTACDEQLLALMLRLKGVDT